VQRFSFRNAYKEMGFFPLMWVELNFLRREAAEMQDVTTK
jgi:hypothetical protein